MFVGYKTYITAGLAIIGAVAAYLVGDSSMVDAAQIVVNALLAAFIRSGMKTT